MLGGQAQAFAKFLRNRHVFTVGFASGSFRSGSVVWLALIRKNGACWFFRSGQSVGKVCGRTFQLINYHQLFPPRLRAPTKRPGVAKRLECVQLAGAFRFFLTSRPKASVSHNRKSWLGGKHWPQLAKKA